MTLRIIKQDDPITVDQLVIVIYGAPGLGKSTLGFTADTPLALDFDKGVHRAANRKDSVPINSWKDAGDITPDDLNPYNTVIVDTAGRALDFLTADIIKNDPKKGHGGALTLQGYGVLKGRFTSWLNGLKIIGKDVVLIAHSSEEHKGDDLIERLDVQGGSKGEIYKSADAMGRLYLVNGKRVLSFSPTDTAFGKNPGNMPPIEIPDVSIAPYVLSETIQKIKDHLNTLTEKQQERMGQIADWTATIENYTTADDFTKAIAFVKKVDASILNVVKGLLHNAATAKGLVFESGAYAEKKAAS